MGQRTTGYHDLMIKLLIIGDSGVGKTCFLLRFSEDSFTQTHLATIGIDFKIKTIEIDGKQIKLQIWDTAGQERFRTITTTYYKGAQGIILAYDVTDETSFNSVRNWMMQIEQHAQQNVAKVLIGNKCDKTEQRVISVEKGKALAQEYNMQFFETSAKTGINVIDTFQAIAREIKNSKLDAPQLNKGVSLTDSKANNEEQKDKIKCCK